MTTNTERSPVASGEQPRRLRPARNWTGERPRGRPARGPICCFVVSPILPRQRSKCRRWPV